MASTFETVASIISSASDVPLEQIKADSHVMKDLDIDSLAFLDITFEIDKSFGIQLPVDEGHFPGLAFMPGVLLLETMAQASGYLVLAMNGFSRMPFFANAKEAN